MRARVRVLNAFLSELQNAKTELNATPDSRVWMIWSRFQVVTFTKYIRKVLPLDGFVFWNESLGPV